MPVLSLKYHRRSFQPSAKTQNLFAFLYELVVLSTVDKIEAEADKHVEA